MKMRMRIRVAAISAAGVSCAVRSMMLVLMIGFSSAIINTSLYKMVSCLSSVTDFWYDVGND
jgi:hypothetical protein